MAKKIKLIYGGDVTRARFKWLRTMGKFSIHKLSKKSGLPEKYISEIETGDAIPPVRHVKRLLDAMNVQAENYKMVRCFIEENPSLG